LGLGPLSTQVGDHACLFFGLRPKERGARSTYTFIGEAYIHGWIDGEISKKRPIGLSKSSFSSKMEIAQILLKLKLPNV
jgi:hypothetical protein